MSFRKVFKLFACKGYLKRLYQFSTSASSFEMVRYFPNTLDDYTTDTTVIIADQEIRPQIEEHIKNIEKRRPPLSKYVDGGLYVGIGGIAYMFYHLSKNAQSEMDKVAYLEKALGYINIVLQHPTPDKTSFLLGDAGAYAVGSVIKKSLGDQGYIELIDSYRNLFNYYLNPKFLKCGGDEFFVGRAGYLAGALWMMQEMKTGVLTNEEMYRLCNVVVASGQDYAKREKIPCPLMYHYYNTKYLGAAHGVSFILQVLLTVPGYLQYNKTSAKDIKETIDYLASIQSEDGNWPSCMEEVGQTEHKLVHWCHGAPGIVYLMARAYLVYKDRTYLNACVRSAELVWNKGLLLKGPGICHGVAGSGYVFLLLYRLTNDPKYLYRAKAFADFMNTDQFQSDARVPDNPETLYEGTAGTACFLSDLLVPDKAHFPFQDVFSFQHE